MKNKLLMALICLLLLVDVGFAQQTRVENSYWIFKGGVLITTNNTTAPLPAGIVFKIIGTSSFDTVTISNIIAQGNIQLGTNYLSGDGGNEGIYVDSTGKVGIGTNLPTSTLYVNGGVTVRGAQTNLGTIQAYDATTTNQVTTLSQLNKAYQNSETVTYIGVTNGFPINWTPPTNTILDSVMFQTIRGASTSVWTMAYALCDTCQVYTTIASNIIADLDGSTATTFSQNTFTGTPNFLFECTNIIGWTWTNTTKAVFRFRSW